MSQARLIYAGPDSVVHTRPPSLGAFANGRWFDVPKWGKCLHWPEWGLPMEDPSLIPVGAEYSMLVIDDLIEKTVNAVVNVPPGAPPAWVENTTNTKGHIVVADLANQWEKYGVVMIKGPLPTLEEIQKAKDNRAKFAKVRFQQSENRYRRGQAGRPGGITEYSDADKEWANETGKKLPDTMAAAEDMEVERVHCPDCKELIVRGAVKCRFCGWRTKLIVMPIPEVSIPAANITCPECGAAFPANGVDCPRCGFVFPVDVEPAPTPEPESGPTPEVIQA